jgi:hypothetical protein
MVYQPTAARVISRVQCCITLGAIVLFAVGAPVCVAATYQCVGKDNKKVFSNTPCGANMLEVETRVPAAGAKHTREMSQLWEYLHLGTDPADYDAMIPLLVRTVAPLDANWGPSHVQWAAVNAMVKRDLHRDIDPINARAQTALAAIWQHALDESLSDEDLSQLLRFYRSALGNDYVEFQLQLTSINSSAAAEMLRAMTTGQTTASRGAQSPTTEQIAARQRVQDLSLSVWLAKSQSGSAAGNDFLSKAVIATRGDVLDALTMRYGSELGEFDSFNHSAAVSKVVAAGALVSGPWSREAVARELQAALVSEPQKRAAEWRAAYAVSADASPQLPRPQLEPPEELESGDALFPAENPHPAHQLEIMGTLPANVPIADFEAIYATDITSKEKVSGPCQRYTNLGPKEFDQFTYPQALEVMRTAPIVRIGERYRAAVAVDQFLPGRCNWHLREIRYRLFVKGYGYELARNNGVGQIQVMDAQRRAVDAAKGGSFYEGQLDIWCGRLLNRNIAPYYPAGCGALDDFRPRVPPEVFAAVPALQRESHSLVYVSPGTRSVQANFHDVDELAAPTPAHP